MSSVESAGRGLLADAGASPAGRRFVARPAKWDVAYAPSFDLDGARLEERQRALLDDVAGVAGWLEGADLFKLYELGHHAAGPFLEIGTYCGKSTTVLTTAIRDSGRAVEFYSLDIAGESLESARATLAERGLGRYVKLVHGSVAALFRAVPDLRPRFVFLDGDHSAAGVGRDLASLEDRVPEGGLLLFHDFVDVRNEDPSDKAYGVPQAIRGSWVARDCEFAGRFGCSGLFRRISGPRDTSSDADAPAQIELIRMDRLAVRLRIEVARPVVRRLRRMLGRPPA